jgi:hypothetical protein
MNPDIINIDGESNISLKIEKSVPLDNSISELPSVNFGSGIELLMNDKRKEGNKTPTNIDIDDINELENDLKNLVSEPKLKSKAEILAKTLNMPIKGNSDSDKKVEFHINKNDPPLIMKGPPTLGNKPVETKTWDGYNKFNDIPLDPNAKIEPPKMTTEEVLKEKFRFLRKLEDLEKKGVKLTKKYSMESNLNEMKGEYEMIISEKEKSNSVKFQGRMLMAAVTGLEFMNNRFDPFDIKLDGWSEQINEGIEDYDDIFGELHEKYKSKAKMAPELKLLFQLGGGAIMAHMTNTMFKSSLPGMDDIMRQNPELMQQFTQAAVNTMGETNPGFSGFMGDFMGGNAGSAGPSQPSYHDNGPPPAVKTQSDRSARPVQSRPDLNMARNDGISIEKQYESVNSPPSQTPTIEKSSKSSRPEMRGPSDITSILANLKTRAGGGVTEEINQNSTISIQELNEMKSTKIPKSKRRGNSAKNTVSLDI